MVGVGWWRGRGSLRGGGGFRVGVVGKIRTGVAKDFVAGCKGFREG